MQKNFEEFSMQDAMRLAATDTGSSAWMRITGLDIRSRTFIVIPPFIICAHSISGFMENIPFLSLFACVIIMLCKIFLQRGSR